MITSATLLLCRAVPDPAPSWQVAQTMFALRAVCAECLPATFGNAVPAGGMSWHVPQLAELKGHEWHVEQDGPERATPVRFVPWQDAFEQDVVPFVPA
jgi:hypothetical protein